MLTMMKSLGLICAVAAAELVRVHATPTPVDNAPFSSSSGPRASISSPEATFTGTIGFPGDVEVFRGVPFAKPPVC